MVFFIFFSFILLFLFSHLAVAFLLVSGFLWVVGMGCKK